MRVRHIFHYLHEQQGELEHSTSKARFRRTDGKQFLKQMAGIERCEAWIRHICNLNNPSHLGTNVKEGVATTSDAHFHIGKSQNFPENIMMFLHKHSKDPAVKVSWPSMRRLCGSPTSNNRIFSRSSDIFYFLKSKRSCFERMDFTPRIIWNSSLAPSLALWKSKFTSQPVAFINTI